MRVLYCRLCGQPTVLGDGAELQPCARPGCCGRYFGSEPPPARQVPLVWTEGDRHFLQALRISVADPEPTGERR